MSEANRRIAKELAEIAESPLPNITAFPSEDDDLTVWTATIHVVNEDSVYYDGTFILEIRFPRDYPFKPPKVRFLTRVYHCNVSDRSGAICLDLLKDQWSPVITVHKLLISIAQLLDDPCPEDPLTPEVSHLYLTNRAEHDAKAREWTEKYAK